MHIFVTLLATLLTVALTTTVQAFCGFYVARADTSLFNKASQVVLVRDDDRTVITMANDFDGDGYAGGYWYAVLSALGDSHGPSCLMSCI